MVKNLTCKAGDIGTIPGQGNKIPYTMWQVSPSATITEPAPQLENPCAPTKDPT